MQPDILELTARGLKLLVAQRSLTSDEHAIVTPYLNGIETYLACRKLGSLTADLQLRKDRRYARRVTEIVSLERHDAIECSRRLHTDAFPAVVEIDDAEGFETRRHGPEV